MQLRKNVKCSGGLNLRTFPITDTTVSYLFRTHLADPKESGFSPNGYESESPFGNALKRVTGLSPRSLRRQILMDIFDEALLSNISGLSRSTSR